MTKVVSIMITTRNRCADLRRTLTRLHRLEPVANEILVTADGCSDGTVEMLRQEFPQCRVWVNDPGLGSIPSRDRMLREASGDLVLSLDDDSYPVEDNFLERMCHVFAERPEVAVMTFPELRDGGVYLPPDKTPRTPGHYVSAYPNGAAAMRRSTYLRAAGYPHCFEHSYEEPDYALQCYAIGAAVWFEPSMAIRHHFSPVNRDDWRTHQFNARNEMWSAWMRCPWPWIPLVLLFRLWRQFCYAWSEGPSWVVREPLWWWSALDGVFDCLRHRSPVPWKTYFAWMRLARYPITTREALERSFDTRTDQG